MGKNHRTITGLDIGTTKVCAIIGAYSESDGTLNILGMGTAPNAGMREGLVIDVGATTEAIVEAVAAAEKMAGNIRVKDVFVGIAGAHITSENRMGSYSVEDVRRGVTAKDRNEALKRALPPTLDLSQHVILMNIPQEFILDDAATGVVDPVDMYASNIKARVHVVYGQRASLENIRKAIRNAGLSVSGVVLESVASSLALLGQEEKNAGVGLIDIGGGTSDVAVFVDEQIRHSCEIPFGGDAITKAISERLRTSLDVAETLKKKYANALCRNVDSSKIFNFPDPVTKEMRQAQQYFLAEIVETKLEEIFARAMEEFERAGVAGKLTGIVLTGGTSLMPAIDKLAQRCFQTDNRAGDFGVRIGVPTNALRGIKAPVESPICSTCVGLVWYGALHPDGISEMLPVTRESMVSKVFESLKYVLTRW